MLRMQPGTPGTNQNREVLQLEAIHCPDRHLAYDASSRNGVRKNTKLQPG